MRFALRIGALLLVVSTVGRTADPAVEELFKQARTKVLDNAKRMPRYTCVETVDRTQYTSRSDQSIDLPITGRDAKGFRRGEGESRGARPAAAGCRGGGQRRDLLVGWGGGKFESRDVGDIVGGGASGSGEFGGFLMGVFGRETDSIAYAGQRNDLSLFNFTVPLAKSSYHYRSTGPDIKMGYHGTILVDPADGDLEQLVVEPDGFPQNDPVCMVRHEMDYTRVKIGSGNFMLPEVSSMDALYHSGAETLNTTHYSNCREYVGESTIHFDDVDASEAATAAKTPLQPLPPKTKLSIALATPINTEVAAAGDAIDGVVLKSGYKVHGRILRLQQILVPTPKWYLEMRFDRIERNGVEQPISLRQLSAPFVFSEHGNLVLDQKLHSDWETK